MKQKILAVCDSEADYACRMMEVMKERKDMCFDIHVFTDVEKLLRFKRAGNDIECLLIAEPSFSEAVGALAIPHVFILSESKAEPDIAPTANDMPVLGMKRHSIYKYQSAERIVNDVMAFYIDQNDALPRKGTESGPGARIIGIYSPVKRCFQTTFSMTLGQILAKQHKTLYLNYECFAGFSQMLGRNIKSDMIDMMYLFECVKEKFVHKLPLITEKINQLDFIGPAAVYPDLMNIPGRQWTLLLDELRSQSDYQYIILDLSVYVNGLLEILVACDVIYTITKGDFMAVAKMEQYERLLHEMDYGNVVEKTQKLNLPLFKHVARGCDEMTYGELASYIRENLLDELYQ